MKTRRPLSAVDEERFFLAADAGCDAVCARLKRHVMARFAAHGKALNGTLFQLGVLHGSGSVMRVAVNAHAGADAWTRALYPDEVTIKKSLMVGKARKPKLGATEAELIDAALDVGIELGLETLPAKARKAVDVAAARRVARSRLMRGSFRANLNALEESQRGLAVLLNASRDPALTVLKDADRLASAFGLNSRQAATIVRETRALVDAGKKTDAIKRAMAKRMRQAIEARAQSLADALGRDAIAVAQSALYEQAKKQGLLDDEKKVAEWEQEWVSRRDGDVCEICDDLDTQRQPIGEPFVSGITGEEFYEADAHPHCRCRKRLVRVQSPMRGRRAA